MSFVPVASFMPFTLRLSLFPLPASGSRFELPKPFENAPELCAISFIDLADSLEFSPLAKMPKQAVIAKVTTAKWRSILGVIGRVVVGWRIVSPVA
jgi:hypothetical protein